jgi:RHS repeat-associated protein
VYYLHRDYLGSILQIADAPGNIVEENSFAPYGERRDPATQLHYAAGLAPTLMLGRGFTAHEHLPRFGLINMNARLYDPLLGRFLSPDPYIQWFESTMGLNRYAYAMNNPLCYVDENGEIAWFIPVIIGAVIGAYTGGVIANDGQFNFTKWDYGSGKTWGYMFGGAVVGGVSGLAGAAVATSGIPMANTLSIMTSSFVNSVGTSMYTGGQTPISMSFGAFSYDFTNGKFGYLGKGGNKWYENMGYAFGAMANLSDALTGFSPQKVDLVTEHTEVVGHSALVKEGTWTGETRPDPNALISVGPDGAGSWHWKTGTNGWWSHSAKGEALWRQTLKVNMNTIRGYARWLNNLEQKGHLVYSLELSSCVTHTSMALNLSGIFNIGIHPYLLNAQMALWSNGIRPWSFNQFMMRR